jgi:hypothetical protein
LTRPYRSSSGTSLAAPIVAGVAALVFSANPTLTPAEVEGILKDTALDLGPAGRDAGFGHGRVNAYRAVLAALPPPTDTTPPAVRIAGPAAGARLDRVQRITIIATDDTAVARVELRANGILIGSVAGNAWGVYRFTWTTPRLPRGTHTLQAVAYDPAGNAGVSAEVAVIK